MEFLKVHLSKRFLSAIMFFSAGLMPQLHCADLRSQLAMMGEILAYSWASEDLILMVWDVNFIVSTDWEAPQIYEKHSAIVTQFSIDQDILHLFLYVFLVFHGFPWRDVFFFYHEWRLRKTLYYDAGMCCDKYGKNMLQIPTMLPNPVAVVPQSIRISLW